MLKRCHFLCYIKIIPGAAHRHRLRLTKHKKGVIAMKKRILSQKDAMKAFVNKEKVTAFKNR